MTSGTINLFREGRWTKAPAAEINGHTVVVVGRAIKMAEVLDEEWMEEEIPDPEACVERLKQRRSHGLRADVFTFAQKLPATAPRYAFPTEWDSIAAIRLNGFTTWWEGLPQETRK